MIYRDKGFPDIPHTAPDCCRPGFDASRVSVLTGKKGVEFLFPLVTLNRRHHAATHAFLSSETVFAYRVFWGKSTARKY